jgi:hypothetical protein
LLAVRLVDGVVVPAELELAQHAPEDVGRKGWLAALEALGELAEPLGLPPAGVVLPEVIVAWNAFLLRCHAILPLDQRVYRLYRDYDSEPSVR